MSVKSNCIIGNTEENLFSNLSKTFLSSKSESILNLDHTKI